MNRRLNKSEAFSLMDEYFQSGQRATEFYRSKHITGWQFYKWKRLYLDAHPVAKASTNMQSVHKASLLQPVNIIGNSSRPAPSLEICYPSGVMLRVGEGEFDIQLLRELVNL